MSTEDPLFLKKGFQRIVEDLLEDLGSGAGGRVALTDATPGSVVRTLVEAFSRELAVAYAQLDRVYQLGYLDTAEGEALDQLVALIGVTRRPGGHLQGTVTFSRATPAPEMIAIPAGTLIAGRKVPVVETVAASVIAGGSNEATVAVISVEPASAPVAAGALAVMPQPLGGIDAVTNRVELIPRAQPETDVELRERARRRIELARIGTITAIEQAVRARGFAEVRVEEPPGRPGAIEVTVGDPGFGDAERDEVRAVLEHVRPAGIQLSVEGVRWVDVKINAKIELGRVLDPPRRQAVEADIEARLRGYIDSLGAKESVRKSKLTSLLAANDEVATVLELVVTPSVSGSDDTARLSTNGDVLIGAKERARIAPGGIALSLEPPAPAVWIDALFQAKSGKTVDSALLRQSISAFLTGSTRTALAWKDVWDELPPSLQDALAALRLVVLHERDGLVTELINAGDVDALDPRESVRLRNVAPEGAA